MPSYSNLQALKLKLANFGAIKPHAWVKIVADLKKITLKTDESFNREIGTVAYVVDGLFKEYDARHRKKPSIINFIGTGSFIITSKFNQSRYLKAVTNTETIYLGFTELLSLFSEYNELKALYDSIDTDYEEGLAFRQFILEENIVSTRIQLFIKRYRPILSDLKKKDIANYIHTDYDYFVRIYGKLL